MVGDLLPLACSRASLRARKVKLGHLKLRILTFNGKGDGFANQLFGIIFEDLNSSTALLRSSMMEYGFSDG